MRISEGQAGAIDSTVKVVDFPRAHRGAAGARDMERINQFDFFNLGQKLKALRAFSGTVAAEPAFIPVWEAFHTVDQLRQGAPIQLGVSRACAAALAAKLDDVLTNHFREVDEDGDNGWKFPTAETPAIPFWRWTQVTKALDEFEMIFREEMREAATYRVPQRGIFDTPRLVDAADETFPVETLSVMTGKARDEWRSAGRCLAFNLLSASGFHVTRAVESTMEHYYNLFSGKSGTLRSWNDYLKALEALDDTAPHGKPSAKTLAELRQMKDDYRNPIAHPRVVLSEPDARMLFANGESLIIAMAQEIRAVAPGLMGLIPQIFREQAAE